MIKLETKIKDWWHELKAKNKNFHFSKTKFINDQLETNVKILDLLNDKIDSVSQLPNFGLIVLNQTILNSHDKTSISEQGVLSSDFFKARIIDVDNTTVKGVYFHLVKVISGIITINPDHELTLIADEQFNKELFKNKLGAKLFNLFLQDTLKSKSSLISKINVTIDDKVFNLKFGKNLISKELIFRNRDLVNEFLESNKINYQKYPFLRDRLTKLEKETINQVELIEIKNFKEDKNNFSVAFLVGSEIISDFLLSSKKELLTSIRIINKKIKLINNKKLSEFHPDLIIDSFEKLERLNQDYLQLKYQFTNFQNQNPDLMKNFINESIETQYSEKIGDYEFVHINFNNLLIDMDILESKALEKINASNDKVLFLSNSNFDNSMVILKLSKNLISKIAIPPLVNQFSNVEFKKINYHQQGSVFIEASNFQVINDFISNIINFFKISNNQTI